MAMLRVGTQKNLLGILLFTVVSLLFFINIKKNNLLLMNAKELVFAKKNDAQFGSFNVEEKIILIKIKPVRLNLFKSIKQYIYF